MKINLQKGGSLKSIPSGFSGTVFFFGPVTLLLRGMILHAILCLLPIIWLFYAFKANEIYIKKLIKNGYESIDDVSSKFIKTL